MTTEVYVSDWQSLNDVDWKSSYSLTLTPTGDDYLYVCREAIINNFHIVPNMFRVINTPNKFAPTIYCNGKICKIMAYSDYYEGIPGYTNITVKNNTAIDLDLIIEFYSSVLSSKPTSLGNRRLS